MGPFPEKFRRNIRAYIVPVELHEKYHGIVVGSPSSASAALMATLAFSANLSASSSISPTASMAARISGQFFLHIEEKGRPRFLGKVEYLLAGCICKINAFTVQLHRDASSLVFQMG